MNKVMSNKAVIALYVLPGLLLLLAVIYVPLALTGYYGLMKWDGIGDMQFAGLSQYERLIQDSRLWQSSYHSLLLALFSTVSLLGYLAVALLLSSGIKAAGLLRKIYLVPMLLSSVAIAQLWLKIYHPTNGVLNTLLEAVGFKHTILWLADPAIVLPAIFIPILWQYAGFYILIYYAALTGVPSTLIDAARIDGARAWQIAFRIKVPLIAGVIKATVVLAIVGSLKYFDLIYVMTGGGPNGSSEVVASYLYNQAFRSFNFGYGSAIGFFLLLLCLIVTWIVRKLTARGEEIQYA